MGFIYSFPFAPVFLPQTIFLLVFFLKGSSISFMLSESQQVDQAILEVLKLFEMENDPSLMPSLSISVFDLKWEVKGSFARKDPFTIWFVFPKKATDKPYIVKGGYADGKQFIQQKSVVAFAHYLQYYSVTKLKHQKRGAEVFGLHNSHHCHISFTTVEGDKFKRETPSYKCKRWVFWVFNTWCDKRFVRKTLPKCFPVELIPYTVEP